MTEINLPQKLKLPSHVLDYHCTKCGECCSDKWNIAVDAASYHKLQQKFTELGRQEEFQDNFSYHSRRPRIQFLTNGNCPYLTDNNLCRMQLELGESYLLDICKIYPRRIFASPYALELSLALTCKTAVNTLQNGPINIIETNWPIEDKEKLAFSFIIPNATSQYFPERCLLEHLPYHVLEKHFIKILQDHRYSISQRLLFLGQELSLLLSGKEMCDISRLSFDITPDLPRHLEHLFFLSNIFSRRFTSKNMSQLLEDILLRLTHQQARFAQIKISPPPPLNYQIMLADYYAQASPSITIILENYFVNALLNKIFYLYPLHLAYYRMTFTYAAIIAFNMCYGLVKNQPLSTQLLLQAIYDVESIFSNLCFYPRAANYQAEQAPLRIIENGIALANINL